jgi:acetyl-CoA acetyltransferase
MRKRRAAIVGVAESDVGRTPHLTVLSQQALAARAALAEAGLTKDSVGFCKPGEARDFIAGGRTAPGGEFPMNTNGGGLSYTHPGMYGIFLLIEAVRQLRGDFAWARQVPDAELALVHGTGGVLSSAATVILGTL